MAAIGETSLRPIPMLAVARAAIGLGQGVAGWLLYEAAKAHAWPATEPQLFAALVFAVAYVPVLAVLGLGTIRPAVLATWLASALVLVVVVAVHEVARSPASAAFAPRPETPAGLVLAVFIAHALVASGDADRRPIAAYATYFDTAWKLVVQLALAAVFLGLFWAVLQLGAELFRLIDLDFLHKLIGKAGFGMPAGGLAFAYGLHVTDVRVGLVQGMRNLLHILLAWLLPVATGLIAAFLASLPFTGLQPLWHTSHGSELLLTAAGALVVLVNTAYRDGVSSPLPAVLRWSGSAAALCLPLLVAIAAYGLYLRIGQHGWSGYRVVGAAWLAVTGCYAAGYAWAAVAGRPWLKSLEATNILAAFVILAAIVALSTAIADPDRLAVGDQVARLESGRVGPDKFDFAYLRFHSGRYGLAALARLKSAAGPNAAAIRSRAEQVLAQKAEYGPSPPAQPAQIAAMPVYPPGEKLPPSLAAQNWRAWQQSWLLPQCLLFARIKCEAFVARDAAGGPIILILEPGMYGHGVAVRQGADGVWRPVGTFFNTIGCDSIEKALRAGQYSWVPPLQLDLQVAGRRLAVTPAPPDPAKCP
jgi:hypothetical protein